MYLFPLGLRSRIWTTMSGISEEDSGEGFARRIETASCVTVLDAIGRKCVGQVFFGEERVNEKWVRAWFCIEERFGGKIGICFEMMCLWAAFSIQCLRASFSQPNKSRHNFLPFSFHFAKDLCRQIMSQNYIILYCFIKLGCKL